MTAEELRSRLVEFAERDLVGELLARLLPEAEGGLGVPPTGDYLFITHWYFTELGE